MVNGRMSRVSHNGGQIQSIVSSLKHHDRLAPRSVHLRPGNSLQDKNNNNKNQNNPAFQHQIACTEKNIPLALF